VELDVEAREELAVNGAAELALTEVFDLGDLTVDGLKDFLQAFDSGLGSLGGTAEVED